MDLSKGLIVAFELFVLSLEKKSLCNVININWKLITMVKRELTGWDSTLENIKICFFFDYIKDICTYELLRRVV